MIKFIKIYKNLKLINFFAFSDPLSPSYKTAFTFFFLKFRPKRKCISPTFLVCIFINNNFWFVNPSPSLLRLHSNGINLVLSFNIRKIWSFYFCRNKSWDHKPSLIFIEKNCLSIIFRLFFTRRNYFKFFHYLRRI